MRRWCGWGEGPISFVSPKFKGRGERQALRGGGHRHSSGGRGTHDSGRAAAAGGKVGAGGRLVLCPRKAVETLTTYINFSCILWNCATSIRFPA